MDSLTQNIFVRDINETIEFYKIIGFDIAMTVPEKGDFVWVMMSCGNVNFMFQSFETLRDELPLVSRQDGGSQLFYIQTKDVRSLHDTIKEKVKVIKGIEKTFYGATEFAIRDNNGYVLTFAENEDGH
jgi:uncharacterized glyoxalase superfamily protein PhnB